MKSTLNAGLLIITLLFLSVNAAPLTSKKLEDAKIVYQGSGEVTYVKYDQCIPFKTSDSKLVDGITFSFEVECRLYGTADCSGQPIGDKPYVIDADDKIDPEEIDDDCFQQSLQCKTGSFSF